ncbi:MAG: hypothetical protein K9I74_12415, partial [Bacteroidales bacterium]|nr:hypothetical protein [Bacteroidales bacterium]
QEVMFQPVLILAVIFGAIVAIVYLQVRRKERMALLQTNKDASVFKTREKKESASLKYGLLLIGVGLGILLANIFVSMGVLSEDVAYFSMVFLFGGIALILDFFLQKKNMKKSEETEEIEEKQE